MNRGSILFLSLALLLASARAEDPLSTLGSAAGVTTVDMKGRNWAYLAWGAGNPELLRGKTFAVYAKAGGPESTASFTRRAVVARQLDGHAIDSLLSRASFIGFNATDVSPVFDQLFTGTLPPGTHTTGEKIAAAMRSANSKSEQLLFLLGSLHPGINFALGLGHAEKITPGKTTFEIRDFDPIAKRDLGLLWRITVDTNAPIILPAPGAPVVVRDCNSGNTAAAKSNLVLPLRWAAPDPLRRLMLFQRGYHVYRMTRAFAEAHSFQTTPPTSSQLHSLVISNSTEVKRASTAPIFPSRNLNAVEAANVAGDLKTIFFSDANGADENLGPRFQNGDAFYYFVTARDLLGREGLVSPAGFAEVFELTPLDTPRDVHAENDFVFTPGSPSAGADQHLIVSWKQADNTGVTRPVLRYLVYRWTSVNDLQLHADDPAPPYQPIATLPHTANNAPLSYKDDGPGSPTSPADAGRVFFYSVRAEADLPCGPVRSPHSGPMPASLHDTVAAQAPTNPVISSPCYGLAVVSSASTLAAPNDNHDYQIELIATRDNPLVDWAEFTVLDTNTSAVRLQERVYFDEAPTATTATLTRNLPRGAGAFNRVLCNTGTSDGKTAAGQANVAAPGINNKLRVNFSAQYHLVPPPSSCVSPAHIADPTGTGAIVPLKVCMDITAETREYRMYRRIDDGPLMLVKQAFPDPRVADTICYDDYALSDGVAIGAYYGQLINDQGSSGPLILLGRSEIVRNPPRPLLAPIIASGTAAAPTMTLRWFCKPGGIERFQVWICADPPSVVSAPSSGFSTNRIAVVTRLPFVLIDGLPEECAFGDMHYSPRVGSSEIGNGPLFTLPLNTKPGVTYTVLIRPVTGSGVSGPFSNAQKFTWSAPAEVGTVPWPARGLPQLNPNFNPAIVASTLRVAGSPTLDSQYPLGVKVADIVVAPINQGFPSESQPLFNAPDPNDLILKNMHGDRLFPCVLYRYQVANAAFPQVSGDLIQASPLIERLAVVRDEAYTLADPFACVRADTFQGTHGGIYLRDTQPALHGASYKYLIVRFASNGEAAEIIPTNVVTLP